MAKKNKKARAAETVSKAPVVATDWTPHASLIAAGVLAYSNSFTGEFVLDDTHAIVGDENIRTLFPPWVSMLSPHGATRPLVGLSLAINYAISGLEPWSYHVFNVLIHIGAALALFAFLRRAFVRIVPGLDGKSIAWAVSLLWLLHPLQTQAVDYAIQRSESMMGLFFLLTFYCLERAFDSEPDSPIQNRWYYVAIATCALSAGCKQVAAAIPILGLLYDRSFVSGSLAAALRKRWGLYASMFLTWAYIPVGIALSLKNESVGVTGAGIGIWEYLRTQFGVVCHYIWLSLVPLNLTFDYRWPIAQTSLEIVPPGLFLAAILGASLWALSRKSAAVRGWGFLGVWFFVILAPSSSFLPLRDVAFEQRMYLSLASVLIAVVLGLHWIYRRTGTARVFGLAIAALAILLGALTFRRNEDYRTVVSLWQDTANKRPQNAYAWDSLGLGLTNEKRFDEAVKALREAVKVKPDLAKAYIDLGFALDAIQRNGPGVQSFRPGDEAERDYLTALELDPHNETALYDLAVRLAERGEIDGAIARYEELLAYHNDFANGHYNLANLYFGKKRFDLAEAHFTEALKYNPGAASTWCNRAATRVEMGKLKEADEDIKEALRLNPNDAFIHNIYGALLSRHGKNAEAIAEFELALRLNPNHAEAQKNLLNLRGR